MKSPTAKDEVRAGEARRLVQDGFEPVLKKTRWCVLKRKENLAGNQRIRLRDILKYNLQTVRAYLLKEQFAQQIGGEGLLSPFRRERELVVKHADVVDQPVDRAPTRQQFAHQAFGIGL